MTPQAAPASLRRSRHLRGPGLRATYVVCGAQTTLERGQGHTHYVPQRRRGRRARNTRGTGTAGNTRGMDLLREAAASAIKDL
jgi:hypothetical protein